MTRFSWHRHLVDGVAYLGRGATPAVGIRGADGLFGPRPRRPPSACGEDSSRCAKAEQCSPASRSNGAQQPSLEHERPRGEFLSVLFGRQALRDAGDDATANAPRSEMPSRAEVLDPVEQPRLRSFPVAAGAPELLVVRVERSRGGRRAAPSAHPACRSPSRTRRSRQLFERLRRQEERLSWLTPYLTLYQAEWCPFSSAVREVLTELGVAFVAWQVEPWPGERNELRAVAGTDQIPVLQTEDGRIYRGTREIFAHLQERDRWRFAAAQRRRFADHRDARESDAAGQLVEYSPVHRALHRTAPRIRGARRLRLPRPLS